jgi:undecaprenyl-diphosphatase
MPLPQVVILAALQGLAEALPISGSAHTAVARLWLEVGAPSPLLVAVLQLGAALGLIVAARRRLLAVLRAFAHPEHFATSPDARDAAVLTVGVGVSLTVSLLVSPRVELWGEPPAATGLGLLLTGLGLASTTLARGLPDGAARRLPAAPPTAPSLPAAALVGLIHGLAIFPGASRVGAALVLLLWLGVRPARAIDLAFLLSVPTLLLRVVQGLGRGGASVPLDNGTLVSGLLFAFLAAVLAAALLRRLGERRRVGALALWLVPLGLALLAYARALPGPGA